MLEIERKFLIKDKSLLDPLLGQGVFIRQGYLFDALDQSLRVRIKSNKAFLTLKFGSSALIREEFEYEIPLEDAEQLWLRCTKKLSKTRYVLTILGDIWEVDVFHDRHEGLILAEIELTDQEQGFHRPPWLGLEVTNDSRYLNVNLAY
jgi:CYTH domain-containing protein